MFTLEGYLTRKAATRASQALLASVIFDPDDNIMLTADGLLPCKKITKNIDQVRTEGSALRCLLTITCVVFRTRV